MYYFILFSTVIIMLANCAPLTLPSWFVTCKANTVEMEKCLIEKSKIVVPYIVKGSKDFKIPNLMPFKVTEVSVQSGNNMNLKLLNVSMYGLETVSLDSVNMNLENSVAKSKLTFKEIKVDGTYDVDGKVLILPIKGRGPCNFVFTDVVIDLDVKWDMNERDNMHYMDITSLGIKYSLGNAVFVLKGLFNGDKRLGDEMNSFLNENWREFSKDVSPAISSMMETVCLKIIGQIGKLVSVEQLFPQ